MTVKVPNIKKADGKVGFPLLKDDNYLLEIKECTSKEADNGQVNFRFNCMVMGNEAGDINDDLLGSPYNEFVRLIDPESQWYKIGLNQLKNAVNAFGIPMKGDSLDLDVSNWDSVQAYAQIRTKQDKPYTNKAGIDVKPEPQNIVKEWFTADEDDE